MKFILDGSELCGGIRIHNPLVFKAAASFTLIRIYRFIKFYFGGWKLDFLVLNLECGFFERILEENYLYMVGSKIVEIFSELNSTDKRRSRGRR